MSAVRLASSLCCCGLRCRGAPLPGTGCISQVEMMPHVSMAGQHNTTPVWPCCAVRLCPLRRASQPCTMLLHSKVPLHTSTNSRRKDVLYMACQRRLVSGLARAAHHQVPDCREHNIPIKSCMATEAGRPKCAGTCECAGNAQECCDEPSLSHWIEFRPSHGESLILQRSATTGLDHAVHFA